MTSYQLHWDERNTEHIARHHVTPEEVEQALTSPNIRGAAYGGRISIIGRTHAGRGITVYLQPIGPEYYPVTARDSSREERRALAEHMPLEGT